MRGRFLVVGLIWLSSCGADDAATSESSSTLEPTMTTPTSATTTPTSATTNTTETSGTDSTSNGSSTTSADGAPFFLSFSTNVGEITDGESVVFTATLSDPDGVEDIVGGTLFTKNGAFSYGPFVAAGQEGTYSISVSWSAIDQVETIEFEDGSIERVFHAEFFDMSGKSASKDTSITLSCEGGGACDGACKDFQSDGEHCGTCGFSCEEGCDDAMCVPTFGECIKKSDGFASCAEYCQSEGEQCVENGCNGVTYNGWNDITFCVRGGAVSAPFSEPCDHVNTWGVKQSAVRCCCSDTP